MSLTTVDRVKSILQIPAGVTFHDVAIGVAVDYANGFVLRAIGQPGGLVATTRTDYPAVYSSSQTDISLDRSPVVQIIGITNAEHAVAADEYRVDKETGRVRIVRGHVGTRRVLASWSDVPDDVVVTYLHGYTEDTVPGDLRRAADIIAAHALERDRQSGKVQVRNGASYGFHVDTVGIPDAAALILSSYEDVNHP